MRYSIRENIGPNGITLQDGQKVYDAIYPELKRGREVALDFTDVRIVASPFLNAAIGQLMKDLTPEELNRYLKIHNLSSISQPILMRVIENAKEYYSNDTFRQAVDNMLEKEATDNDVD